MVRKSKPQMDDVTLRVATPIARAWAQFRQSRSYKDMSNLDGAALLLAMDADRDSERKPAQRASQILGFEDNIDPLEIMAAMRYIARCRRETELDRWAERGPECHASVERLRKRHQLKALEDAQAFVRYLNAMDANP